MAGRKGNRNPLKQFSFVIENVQLQMTSMVNRSVKLGGGPVLPLAKNGLSKWLIQKVQKVETKNAPGAESDAVNRAP